MSLTERWNVESSGRLIALCGLDGSGKTTQAKLLEEHLSTRRDVYRTRPVTNAFRNDPTLKAYLEGSLSPTARESVVPELALFSAMDRLRHMRVEILPRLESGEVVISDRYVYSSYAWMVARGIKDVEWLIALNRYLPEPDATIYFDITPEISVQRIFGRGDTPRWEEVDHERMSRVREVFLEQVWGRSSRYHIIDGSRPVDDVRSEVNKIVENALRSGRGADERIA